MISIAKMRSFGRKFWAKATARFNARVNKRPGDVKRAIDVMAKQFERDRTVSGSEIYAVRGQASLEAKIFELEEIEAGQTSERNSSNARQKPRKTQPNPIHLLIIRMLKRNKNISNSEILSALINEAENGYTGSIELSADKKSFVATGENAKCFRIAEKNLPSIISRLRGEID
jgi:hypothetical protein